MLIYLVMGLLIFFAVHTVPALDVKDSFVQKMGPLGYKGLFTLVTLAGFFLIIYGKAYSEFEPIWNPPAINRYITMSIMLFADFLLATSLIPNNFRRRIRHPMLIGVFLWGLAHLISNGDLASILLFASFLIFAISKIRTQSKRGPFEPPERVSVVLDITTVLLGLTIYLAFIYFHRYIGGISLF